MVGEFDNMTVTNTLQGKSLGFLVRCKEAYDLIQGLLCDNLPWGLVPDSKLGYQYDAEVRSNMKKKILKSMEVLEGAIDAMDLSEIAISYNGGKDCLVMLIIVLATIHKMFIKTGKFGQLPENYKLECIYINSEIPFPNLTEFIQDSTKHYHLHPITIKSSLKEGFEKYLNEINPNIRAIIVGIRYSDPYGRELKYQDPTDHNWPKFLRIHPILHWNYVDIWDFIVGCNLTYCTMYDEGYTSLGGRYNTFPNPYLKNEDGTYLPAYMLREDADDRERLGRSK